MRYLTILALLLSACAATDAQQGAADQGGTVGQTPSVVIVIGGAGVNTTVAQTPTAAPAATSNADAEQKADQTTDVKVDPEAVADAVKTLGGVPDLPEPAPSE